MSNELNTKYSNLIDQHLEGIQKSSSSLMNESRSEAISLFKDKGIPSIHQESYKYTNVLPLFNMDWNLPSKAANSKIDVGDIFHCDVPDLDTYVVITINGSYFGLQKGSQDLPKEIKIGSISDIGNENPELIKEHIKNRINREKDSLVAMNTAFSFDGIFIHVPKGFVLEKPIQIVNLLTGDKPLLTHIRNIIVADENSQAKVVVCDHTLSAEKFLANSVTEFVVKPSANLEFYNIQNQHNNSYQISSYYASVYRDAFFHSNIISLHGGLIRNNMFVSLLEQGAQADVSGLSLTDRQQHVDNATFIEHAAPNCVSNQFYKSILDEQSSTAFTGRILVKEGAQQTNAYQTNKNLLLTSDASANSRPQLEIYADDVKCSHGATSGQIDEEAMFYLSSRGINKREARMLMMFAFAFEIIEKIKIKPLAERIEELINKRLRGELSRCNNCEIKCQ